MLLVGGLLVRGVVVLDLEFDAPEDERKDVLDTVPVPVPVMMTVGGLVVGGVKGGSLGSGIRVVL